MTTSDIIPDLRDLILRAAPDQEAVVAVATCGVDERLDTLMPFSSIVALGVIVAVEDRYGIAVTKDAYQQALDGGITLNKIATMVQSLQRPVTTP